MDWYSRSVRVCAGATVIESPVWTPHGVHVLDGTDDDYVVSEITDDFELVFLPAQNRLLDQALVNGRKIKTAAQDIHEFFAVVGYAAARTTEGKRWTDDYGKADLGCEIGTVTNIVYQRGARNIEADTRHGVLEEEAVFRLLDGFKAGADHFDVVFFENAGVGKIDGKVQRRLATDGRQQGKFTRAMTIAVSHPLALAADDLLSVLRGQRLDISAISEFRIGHDGGRVGIHQHHLVALSLESLAGLGPRVIEFRRLPDHDRPGANHENFGYIVPAWHFYSSVRFALILVVLRGCSDLTGL